MGEIKRRNRILPQHPQTEKMMKIEFFEQIIKQEVDKVIRDSYGTEKIHAFQPLANELSNTHRIR